jgi:hypothetical protein
MSEAIYEEVYRTCTRCKEAWPDDAEFYRPDRSQCRACEYETRAQAPSRTTEARREWNERRRKT